MVAIQACFIISSMDFLMRRCRGPGWLKIQILDWNPLKCVGPDVLSCMEGAMLKNDVLGYASFVDTPGIHNGHGVERTSQHRKIILWCAQKCDMILLFFDLYKPKICAEFKWLLSSLRGHEHKIRIVIHKVDGINPEKVTKAYGSLMWSLGKVINSPDACPAYWIMDFAKRAKEAKIHSCIMSHLKKKMPFSWRITDQFQICDNLEDDFEKVSKKFGIPLEEFPRVDKYKEVLNHDYDFNKLKKLKPKLELVKTVEDMLAYDIPLLLC